MSFLQRFGYYIGGFSVGLLFLAFFFNGKNTSCSYGPNARTIKNINSKNIVFADNLSQQMQNLKIDTAVVKNTLRYGNVLFSKSEPRKKPCGIYKIENEHNHKTVLVTVENCEKQATVKSVEMQ